MRLSILLAVMLLGAPVYAGSDPPPAGALPSCPQPSSSIAVTTSPEVAGLNIGTNNALSSPELEFHMCIGSFDRMLV